MTLADLWYALVAAYFLWLAALVAGTAALVYLTGRAVIDRCSRVFRR